MQPSPAEPHELIAAIDLGSNSFHIVRARNSHGEIRILERLGEKIQLAAGLDESRLLSEEAIQRGLDCLRRFAQLIVGMPRGAVRVVGTNALREARNRAEFIQRAEAVLGHAVEVISGREEARLIYLGVSHSMPDVPGRRLVTDIGGGSTEFIIGQRFETLQRESLQMGCVSYTKRFFADGKITAAQYARAYTAARLELMNIDQGLREMGWHQALGASGTIRAVALAIQAAGRGNGEITPDGIEWLKRKLLKQGDINLLTIDGVKPDRRAILPGGLAILEALFKALELQDMHLSEGALREGVLYDMIGRHSHEDVRERTLKALAERYHVDQRHAERVEKRALKSLAQVADAWGLTDENHAELLRWAARLHGVGLDIAHYQYHKHGAYLIEHSDLAGFSRRDQQALALLVRGHRRNIPVERLQELGPEGEPLLRLTLLLRFAILFHHIRHKSIPDVQLSAGERSLDVQFPDGWLAENPLTQADFELEAQWLERVGYSLSVR